MVQWLGIQLPMQGTQVQFLVREDSARTEQLSLYATAPELALCSYGSPCASQLEPCSRTREATALRNLRTARKTSSCRLQRGKARAQQQGPSVTENK